MEAKRTRDKDARIRVAFVAGRLKGLEPVLERFRPNREHRAGQSRQAGFESNSALDGYWDCVEHELNQYETSLNSNHDLLTCYLHHLRAFCDQNGGYWSWRRPKGKTRRQLTTRWGQRCTGVGREGLWRIEGVGCCEEEQLLTRARLEA